MLGATPANTCAIFHTRNKGESLAQEKAFILSGIYTACGLVLTHDSEPSMMCQCYTNALPLGIIEGGANSDLYSLFCCPCVVCHPCLSVVSVCCVSLNLYLPEAHLLDLDLSVPVRMSVLFVFHYQSALLIFTEQHKESCGGNGGICPRFT